MTNKEVKMTDTALEVEKLREQEAVGEDAVRPQNEVGATSEASQVAEPREPQIDYQAKFKEAQDLYLRTHADFENVKKRLEKDKAMALEYAYEKIAQDLLPVIDTLHAALKSAQQEGSEAVCQGLELTLQKMHEVLAKHGIECVECDTDFDPNLHNAIMQVQAQGQEEGQIVEVFQKGYKYKERLLRPAMVSIAKNN
ncbi:nucleotide exchange factor GrpE [Helicobacter ailurogastricus]|uniref:Protein GrpE n=1 Tax=Helicobacter ailurogastricus TaxID=1578720 RepID=A0A0K2X6Z3_9HELI|nr:nucleotide exchange factor GrpE [Helicobacter ailurogastricus]CRF40484.1 Heat shock protein GrpE [Helicobacter ailurogastricus]CRF43457.1 Heat shock protein GrpE [Helicobacter ailurogastricus]CRF44010.1 Heat shock protein GrpE [Helicobacter ailurogastricus]